MWSCRVTLAPGMNFKLCQPSSARPLSAFRCSNFAFPLFKPSEHDSASRTLPVPCGPTWSDPGTKKAFQAVSASSARVICSSRLLWCCFPDFSSRFRSLFLLLCFCRHLPPKASPGVSKWSGCNNKGCIGCIKLFLWFRVHLGRHQVHPTAI